MDNQSIFIGIIIALICCIPFIILYYNRRKQQNQLLKSLQNVAHKNNATINEFEIFNNSVIAMDKEKHLAFFVKNENSSVVNLKHTEHCYLNVNKQTSRNSNNDIIISADICFKHANKNDSKFPVYDEEIDPPLSGETLFSTKWVNTFNQEIKRVA